jgi:TolB protein
VLKRLRLILGLALVALAALSLGASAASAGPKEIAYICKGEDICLLDPDNPSAVFNLTDNGTTSFESEPAWSPDGKRLAFVAKFTSPASEDIYTMEPEGAGQTFNLATQVTDFVGVTPTITELAWSPDGTKIAFVRGGSPGSIPVYVANADGSSANPTVVSAASGGGGTPTWAPDSAKIAYWHGNQIYTVPPDASSPATPLPGATCTEPAWSPLGDKIACGNFRSNVQIYSLTGGSPPSTISNFSQWTFGAWSPSGAQFAYREEAGENAYFRIVNADGTGDHGLPIVQKLNAGDGPPSWSPDGTRLVFTGSNFSSEPHTNEVYIANADGSGSVTPLTLDQGVHPTHPVWRPNPVAHPGPQVITPSGGSTGPLPGPTIKPKLKWFTNRIFYSEGGSPYVPMLIVACGGPVCNAGGTGTTKASVAAGIRPRPALAARAGTKSKTSKKPIVVAKGKVHVPAGQKRVLKLKLTKLAIAIIEKVGKLKMSVTVTTTIAGQKPSKETRSVTIILKPKPKHP